MRWDRAAAKAGKRATVFCLSLGDIWDNEVDPLWRRQAFEVMESTPHLVYLLLSKRIGNAIRMCDPTKGDCRGLPRNAALGATMISQEEWDRDRTKLKEAARVLGPPFTFASIEPMLGPIDMRGDLPNWVIVGGESGPHARPMHPKWARDVRDQCEAAGVSFHYKQTGEWVPLCDPEDGWWPTDSRTCIRLTYSGERHDGGYPMQRVGTKHAGRLLDGIEHNDMPEIGPCS